MSLDNKSELKNNLDRYINTSMKIISNQIAKRFQQIENKIHNIQLRVDILENPNNDKVEKASEIKETKRTKSIQDNDLLSALKFLEESE